MGLTVGDCKKLIPRGKRIVPRRRDKYRTCNDPMAIKNRRPNSIANTITWFIEYFFGCKYRNF